MYKLKPLNLVCVFRVKKKFPIWRSSLAARSTAKDDFCKSIAWSQVDPDLTTALSNDPLGVAGRLLSKELICREVYSKMLIGSYTPAEKAAILIEAVGNTVEITPVKFQCFLEILSKVVCAKEVVERLRSTYQSESLSSLELAR